MPALGPREEEVGSSSRHVQRSKSCPPIPVSTRSRHKIFALLSPGREADSDGNWPDVTTKTRVGVFNQAEFDFDLFQPLPKEMRILSLPWEYPRMAPRARDGPETSDETIAKLKNSQHNGTFWHPSSYTWVGGNTHERT